MHTSRQTRKNCTFDELPPERKKPAKRPPPPQDDSTLPSLAGPSRLNGHHHHNSGPTFSGGGGVFGGGGAGAGSGYVSGGGESSKRQRTGAGTGTGVGASSDLEGMHALMEAATQAEYHQHSSQYPYPHQSQYQNPYQNGQPRYQYLPHPTHSRTRWSYGQGGGYTSYGGIPGAVSASSSSSGAAGSGSVSAGAMPLPNEPASFDLSVSETLAPHVITVILTDDLLPIGTRQAGPESSQAEVSGGGAGGGGGGGGQKSGYIRQISVDRSKPQVCVFLESLWVFGVFGWRSSFLSYTTTSHRLRPSHSGGLLLISMSLAHVSFHSSISPSFPFLFVRRRRIFSPHLCKLTITRPFDALGSTSYLTTNRIVSTTSTSSSLSFASWPVLMTLYPSFCSVSQLATTQAV